MNLFTLVKRNLMYRPLPSILCILSVAVGTAMVISLLIMSSGLNRGIVEQGAKYDIVAGAQGSPTQLVLSTLFHYENPIGNIPYQVYLDMKANPKVSDAVPLALGDSYAGFRIAGTTTDYFKEHNFKELPGDVTWREGDVVLGYRVAADTGLVVGDTFQGIHGIMCAHEAHNQGAETHDLVYTVVGILGETGGGDDLLVFTPLESVWAAHPPAEGAIESRHDHGHGDHTNLEVTAILLKVPGIVEQMEVKKLLDTYHGVQGVHIVQVLRQLLNTVGNGTVLVSLIAYTALGLAAMSILVSLVASLAERRKDAAVLRVLGARKTTVLKSVVVEAMTLTTAGVILGVGMAHLASYFLGGWITHKTGIILPAFQIVPGEIAAVLAILILGLLAGIVSGWSLYKTQPTNFLE